MEVYTLEEIDGSLIGIFDSIAAIREFYKEEDSDFPERASMTDEEYRIALEDDEIYACLTEVATCSSINESESITQML